MESKVVAVTGHRPDKIGGYDEKNPLRVWLRSQMYRALVDVQATKAISGMALGIDQDFFKLAARVLKLPTTAAVPFLGQEKAWPTPSQEEYHRLLQEAADVVYVSDPGYAAWKMQVRNKWMVDNCDLLIAVWDGTPGGTANCVQYAESKKVNKPIVRINPKDFKHE